MAGRHERKAAIDFGFLKEKVNLATEEENIKKSFCMGSNQRHM